MRFLAIVFLGVGLLACGSDEAPAESAPPPVVAPPVVTPPPPPPPPPVAAVTVASCPSPFGFCEEWAGTQWQALGADDAAREASARSSCRSDFVLGQACPREGMTGTCAKARSVTVYTGSARTSESSCRTSHGLWSAAE